MFDFTNWVITSHEYDLSQQRHEETVFTIGNGYLSTRGTFEEGSPNESHTTFVHGVFDDIPVVFTELVNLPNWISLEILIDGQRFTMDQGRVLNYERELDLRTGVLIRSVRWQSPAGKTLEFKFERFASLANQHLLLLRAAITPVDFVGKVEIHSEINGSESTLGFQHWSWISQGVKGDKAWLAAKTLNTQIEMGLAVRLTLTNGQSLQQTGWNLKEHPTLCASWEAVPGQTVTIEKTTAIFTNRDVENPLQMAQDTLDSQPQPAYATAYQAHEAAWIDEWKKCDVEVDGDAEAQIAIRLNIYHLLIAAPRHDERVNIGAKTLSGYGYRGHSFWDTEIFMLPFFTFTRPEIARNLLSYRWHNLAGARKKALDNGFKGAQFPWESAGTGEEVTPTWVPSPTSRTELIRIWTGDIEIHVSSDIAYAVWNYWQMTGDDAFMSERGAEIILETARYWATRAEWKAETRRYEFSDVIGPDEYHDHVDNNAYTNAFARWNLRAALKVVEWLRKNYPIQYQVLSQKIELKAEELPEWNQVAENIFVAYDPETRLIEQFSGYFQRQDLNLDQYKDRTISMQALLGIEGANQTQIMKQPDVLMLLYLLPDEFDQKTLQVNYDYYTPRTDHTYGSSLGPAIQAIMACWMGRKEESYEHFMRAARAELYDVRGNASDGIHGASAGGLWQTVVFGFAGLRVNSDGTWTTQAHFPAGWKRVSFKFFYHGKIQQVEVMNE